MSERYGVLLVQLGTPASPSPADVRAFLKVFLGDPRVVDFKSIFWKILLHGYILPTRPKKVSQAYAKIWDGRQFPLSRFSEAYVAGLQEELKNRQLDDIIVRWVACIGEPNMVDALKELYALGCKRIRVIPQFPQYSEATVESAWDKLAESLKEAPLPQGVLLEKVQSYSTNPAYIQALAGLCQRTIDAEKPEKILLSFHGYPLRRIEAGDPYMDQCFETAQALMSQLQGISPENVLITFQSKFGREQWLNPSTEEVLLDLANDGIKNVAVCCPAFTVDCLETDEEIGIGLKEEFLAAGGEKFKKIDGLNADKTWVKGTVDHLIRPKLEELPKLTVAKPILKQPVQVWKSEPLSPEAKVSLRSIFMVLFLDLVGFSIIFPLFPRMLEYYEQSEGQQGLFGLMMSGIHVLEGLLGGASGYHAVLFGGILGSVYSILQFVCSPYVGSLSDRYGRRPILIISIFGIAVSYALWFFSGTFAMLVVARLLGGMMSGNISTATAVVADVTKPSNRSRGMATIGIAFGLGFIIGPALGAFATKIDLTELFPSLVAYGVNPFSGAALLAFGLSVFNLWYVIKRFKESLPPEKRGKVSSQRSINPFALFRVEKYPGVTLNNWIYFLFLIAFSGMEFTLTFLTFERFNYSNMDQGMMFVFIGFVLVMVQGGYVRRKASIVGERKMAFRGLVFLAPGLLLLGISQHSVLFYVGLFLMAMGSAQVIPCLTALVSQYTPPQDQGRVVGLFRSLGALARACGPLMACFFYWKLGSMAFYICGAIFVLFPLVLVRRLPEPQFAKE
jgi:ferrochelatase